MASQVGVVRSKLLPNPARGFPLLGTMELKAGAARASCRPCREPAPHLLRLDLAHLGGTGRLPRASPGDGNQPGTRVLGEKRQLQAQGKVLGVGGGLGM